MNGIVQDIMMKDLNKELQNSTAGYEQAITTLTGIKSKIIKQKFYQLNGKSISDYIPVLVGENAFMEEIFTWVELDNTGKFEDAIIDTAKGGSRLAETEVSLDKKTVKVVTWARKHGYTTIDMMKAQKATGNAGWSYIKSLETSKKRNWDLGLQRTAFLGLTTDTDVKGLLNQTDIVSDTVTITKALKDMTYTEFNVALKNLISSYIANNNNTEMPDTLLISSTDLAGLTIPFNPQYPSGDSRLEYMLKSFKTATDNDSFKIMPLLYCAEANNNLGLSRYVLYRRASGGEVSGEMQIPVNYTSTTIGTKDNFSFESVAYGQFTGFKAYRPAEYIYFDF